MNRRSFFIILLVSLLSVSAARAQEIFEIRKGFYSTDTLVTSVPAAGNVQLQIKSAIHLAGGITITSTDTEEIRVAYTKRAKADTRSQAIDFIDLISVALLGKPDAITLELRAPNPAPWSGTNYSGRIEAEVFVPRGCGIDIDASYFDIRVLGPLRSLVIPESLGRLEVTGITEKLDITTANRRITMRDIRGEVSATTSNDSLIAEAVVSLKGQARFRNDGGDIRISDFDGSINAKNSFGRITIDGFRPGGESSFIRGSFAPIALQIDEMSEGQLVVSNRHEDIDISVPDNISAYFSLTVGDDGTIEATGFPVRTELVQRNRLNLISGEGVVDVSGSIRGEGNIYIRGFKGD